MTVVGASRLLRTALGLGAVLALTATATPSPTPDLRSGEEGTKAALVRIEVSAVAEIVHIDHTTGEVVLSRGRYTVPLGTGTGVLTSSDGVVATAWQNLAVDENQVAVYAANELFTKEIKTEVVGNDGDPTRRGHATDPYWAPHLQHCYDRVTHCVLFTVPQYQVFTYTTQPGTSRAELVNQPSRPTDVALLRIAGGGGAPTARLAPADAEPAKDAALAGFTAAPTPEQPPAETPVSVDPAAAQITSDADLSASLGSGLAGGPVLNRATGEVLGLAVAGAPGASATLVPAAAVQQAMDDAGLKTSPSQFDAVFRRGIDHLSQGGMAGSAESDLEESLSYYDSALATYHLQQAKEQAADQPKGDDMGMGAGAGSESGLRAAVVIPVAAVLALALAAGILLLRRRRAAPAAAPAAGAQPAADTATAARGGPAADTATAGTSPRGAASSPRGAPESPVVGAPGSPHRSGAPGAARATGAARPPAADQAPTPSPGVAKPAGGPERAQPPERAGGLGETRSAGGLAPRAVAGPPAGAASGVDAGGGAGPDRSATGGSAGPDASRPASAGPEPSRPGQGVGSAPAPDGAPAGGAPADGAPTGVAFCAQCGHRVSPGARYCTACGQRVR
ncbi:zinc-ribbon domain-containing protein [Georgenia sp. SYP-B2076]|uniref:trypsin-like peptidase domain-containing protein n=1 Tax=Georgenia sp. SYP-B2076 TaxID=2495881 RepID=UPI000F8D1E4B|nr:zinc-ribbon domain-containing protein [Georgenia sp. SYP-B2076]